MNPTLLLADRGLIPLPLLRLSARKLCARRLRGQGDQPSLVTAAWVHGMGRASGSDPLNHAPEGDLGGRHEVPPAFFEAALGPMLKGSSGFFPSGDEDLETGEARMLDIMSERAQLEDGQRVLDLGCGWGSSTLWMAERFPASTIVGVTDSGAQRKFIESRAAEKGLTNVELWASSHDPSPPQTGSTAPSEGSVGFDRVLCIETLERTLDWRPLLHRVRRLLKPEGRLFVQLAAHRTLNCALGPQDSADWLAQHHYSGGVLPADDLLPHLIEESDLQFEIEDHSVVSGRHYSRSAKLWRENIEQKKQSLMPVLRRTYGADAPIWFQRWRLFFLSCEELFGYEGGSEWGVSHYRLAPTPFPGSPEPTPTARSASDQEASATGQAVTH